MTFVKRAFDIFVSIIMLCLLAVPFLLISIVSVICQGSPVFLRQERYGKDGKPFTIYKFRTMRNSAPSVASNSIDEGYITLWGKFLRKTSIDELPQFINVLKGEMSIVGPRPLITAEQEIHKLRQQNGIYAVRPGITGWAQINGRDEVSIERKTELDREYVEKCSPAFDLKILLRSVSSVIGQKGVRK